MVETVPSCSRCRVYLFSAEESPELKLPPSRVHMGIARMPQERSCCFTSAFPLPSWVGWWLHRGIQENPLDQILQDAWRCGKKSRFCGFKLLKCELAMELHLPLVQGGPGEAGMDDAKCRFLRRGMWQGVKGVSDSSYLRRISKILPVSSLTAFLKARSAFEESCTFM